MKLAENAWNDQQVEELLGKLLRAGVIIAAAVVLAGGIVYLVRHGAETPNYRFFHGEPTDLRRVSGILTNVLTLRGRGLIQFGVLMLILTPVARVAFSLLAFIRQRDYTYVVVTALVLALLLYGLVGGYL